MQNKLYLALTLIFVFLSLGILVYVLVNRNSEENRIFNMGPISRKVGEVEIKVVPEVTKETIYLEILLDTHSVELNYDLVAISYLINEKNQMLKPTAWEGDSPGGHHRRGKLIFPAYSQMPKTITLIINGIENEGIKFEWDIGKGGEKL